MLKLPLLHIFLRKHFRIRIFSLFLNLFLISNLAFDLRGEALRPVSHCLFVHNMYNAFDTNPSLEVRGVFFDISKVFDRVWHNGLLYKLNA